MQARENRYANMMEEYSQINLRLKERLQKIENTVAAIGPMMRQKADEIDHSMDKKGPLSPRESSESDEFTAGGTDMLAPHKNLFRRGNIEYIYFKKQKNSKEKHLYYNTYKRFDLSAK